MALGKRTAKQSEMFIATAALPKTPAHPFYSRLNTVLAESQFDPFVEDLCEPFYKQGGRPGIPPGVYFRMLFIGYFEGIDSQRGIAWRCADSRSLREFLGADLTEATPAHNSMTVIRQRLPENIFESVFAHVLGVLDQNGLLKGKTLGIDATTLEANAAMRSIVRKADGKDWKEFVRALAKAEGIENPTDEDLRRIDRGRKDKKVSNEEWENPHDPDARIARMKDGRTHLAYKAEHAIDLETEAIVAAQVTHADRGDAQTGRETILAAQVHLVQSGSEAELKEVVQDKGYHDNAHLAWCAAWGLRTYIPERKQKSRTWTNKPEEYEAAFRANRRRVRAPAQPLAQRAVRTELCACVRDGRWSADVAARRGQREQEPPDALLRLQSWIADEKTLRRGQAAERRRRRGAVFCHGSAARGCLADMGAERATDLCAYRRPHSNCTDVSPGSAIILDTTILA
jgi:transposase